MINHPPKVPEDQTLYVIGDLHGRSDLLRELMKRIEIDAAHRHTRDKELIFLGDYIDRGVDTRGVLTYLLEELPQGLKATFLRGNHEDALLRFCSGDFSLATDWLTLGGMAALASYGVNPFKASATQNLESLRQTFVEKIPPEHLAFLKDTITHCTRGDYHFVHAGIKPGLPLEEQTDETRLWIRYEFLSSTVQHPKMIVHGHTVFDEPDIQPNRIGIDTGAYATGILTCLILENETRRFLTT